MRSASLQTTIKGRGEKISDKTSPRDTQLCDVALNPFNRFRAKRRKMARSTLFDDFVEVVLTYKDNIELILE